MKLNKKNIVVIIFITLMTSLFINLNAAEIVLTAIEKEIFDLVNAERSKASASALVLNEKLNNMASSHVKKMAEQSFYSYVDKEGRDTLDRIKDFYPNMIGDVSENIYKLDIPLMSDKSAAKKIVGDWVDKGENKKLIVNKKYNYTGVAVYKKGINTFASQVFINIIAEIVDAPKESSENKKVTFTYKIMNNAKADDFKLLVAMPDKEAQIPVEGEEGRFYVGSAYYKLKEGNNNTISATFETAYGNGDYSVTLVYNNAYFDNSKTVLKVK